eukprot:10551016-Lingulodinium_polyedra.AAC.1
MGQEHPLARVHHVGALQCLRAANNRRPRGLKRHLDPRRRSLKSPDPGVAKRQPEAAGDLGPHLCPMIS